MSVGGAHDPPKALLKRQVDDERGSAGVLRLPKETVVEQTRGSSDQSYQSFLNVPLPRGSGDKLSVG